MGADIHSWAEIKRHNKWERIKESIFPNYGTTKTNEPFSNRSYSVFGFLADVRNYSECKPISEPRGLPDDSEYLNSVLEYAYSSKQEIENNGNYHSFSYLTLKELVDFDYDQTFWNRRVTKTEFFSDVGSYTNGAARAKEGEGTTISYREHLGADFFVDLEVLRSLGKPEDVRIVFYFDN